MSGFFYDPESKNDSLEDYGIRPPSPKPEFVSIWQTETRKGHVRPSFGGIIHEQDIGMDIPVTVERAGIKQTFRQMREISRYYDHDGEEYKRLPHSERLIASLSGEPIRKSFVNFPEAPPLPPPPPPSASSATSLSSSSSEKTLVKTSRTVCDDQTIPFSFLLPAGRNPFVLDSKYDTPEESDVSQSMDIDQPPKVNGASDALAPVPSPVDPHSNWSNSESDGLNDLTDMATAVDNIPQNAYRPEATIPQPPPVPAKLQTPEVQPPEAQPPEVQPPKAQLPKVQPPEVQPPASSSSDATHLERLPYPVSQAKIVPISAQAGPSIKRRPQGSTAVRNRPSPIATVSRVTKKKVVRDGGELRPPIREDFPQASSSKSPTQASAGGERKFPCPKGCDKWFTRKNDVQRHLKTAAVHRNFSDDQEDTTKCRMCGRILSRGDAARRHEQESACGKRTLPSEQKGKQPADKKTQTPEQNPKDSTAATTSKAKIRK